MKQYLINPKIIGLLILLLSMFGFFGYQQNFHASTPPEPVSAAESSEASDILRVPIEMIPEDDINSLDATSVSWPGEVTSNSDLQVYPAREGQIVEWNVHIGDTVKKGQVLGRLGQPPVTRELTSLLADRQQALINARAQAEATEELVEESGKRLETVQQALLASRDASIAVTERDALQNVSTNVGAEAELEALQTKKAATVKAASAELEQAESLLSIKKQSARTAIQGLIQRMLGQLTDTGSVPSIPGQVKSMQFNYTYGMQDSTVRNKFLTTLQNLLEALQDTESLPEFQASAYAQAALKLLAATPGTAEVDTQKLDDLRNIVMEDQTAYLDALRDYKEALSDVTVSKANLEKMTANMDQEIIEAETTARTSQVLVENADSLVESQTADTQSQYAREKADLDIRTTELKVQLDLANAGVKAAEAAYGIVAAGIGGQTIVAQKGGVISAIYSKIGTYADPYTPIALISGENVQDRFVRFRVPSDKNMPEVGEEISVERPNFPLQAKKAKITGRGLTLDENGFFQVDATFMDTADWSVGTSVRAILANQVQSITIPFTAIWWDDQGQAQVWLLDDQNKVSLQPVRVGKAVGDRVEIEEGLERGAMYVSAPTAELKPGKTVQDSGLQTGQTTSGAMEEMGH